MEPQREYDGWRKTLGSGDFEDARVHAQALLVLVNEQGREPTWSVRQRQAFFEWVRRNMPGMSGLGAVETRRAVHFDPWTR